MAEQTQVLFWQDVGSQKPRRQAVGFIALLTCRIKIVLKFIVT